MPTRLPTPTDGSASISTEKRARDLDNQFVKGVAWTGTSRLASQIISWASFLAVARILSPGDFGIIAGATSVVGFVGLIAEFGLGTAIVAKAELAEDELRQLLGMAAIAAVGAWVTCAILGFPVASAMRIPELTKVLPLVGVTIALTTINAVPSAALRRHMVFRSLSQFEMAKAVLAALAMLAFAMIGFGFWAPLTADLLATIVMTVMLFRSTRLKIKMPRPGAIGEALRFSRDVLVSRAAWYAYSNADFFVVGRQLGKAVLGDYSMAWTLINLPSEKVATLIFSVTPSIFARVRENLPEFRRYVLLLFESLAMLLIPMSAGIGLVARDTVAVVLGEKWHNATPLIQALALFAVIKSVSPLSAQILISRGRTAAARSQSIWGIAILPASFLLASRYGPVAVALVWTTVYPILVAFQIRTAAREIDLPMRTIARRIAPVVLSTAVMTGAVLGAQHLLADSAIAPVARLAISVGVGAVVYTAGLVLLARERLRAAWTFVRVRA